MDVVLICIAYKCGFNRRDVVAHALLTRLVYVIHYCSNQSGVSGIAPGGRSKKGNRVNHIRKAANSNISCILVN